MRLRNLSVVEVDEFLRNLGDRGLSRTSLATAAKSLRRFFHYAYEHGWCRRDVAEAILAPCLFRQEDVPQGPAWAAGAVTGCAGCLTSNAASVAGKSATDFTDEFRSGARR